MMQSPFTSILRGVNAANDRQLHILCSDTHEAYQSLLARTGHLFYSISHPSFHKWNCRFRPYPWNYQPLQGQQPDDQIKPDMEFDLVLSQNKFSQFQVLSPFATRFACPLVSLEHTLPVPQWTQAMRDSMRNMRGDVDVFISEYSMNEWGYNPNDPSVRVVHHGIDTKFFRDWVGGDGKILTVVNGYVARDWCCGYSIYKAITKNLPTNPCGDTPGLSKAAEDEDHLLSLYRGASVFLNTSTVSPVPTALLEAMAVGCPVVTTATCMMPSIIEDGVNGYISDDLNILRERVIELIAHPEKGKAIGEAGRRTVVARFGQEQFVNAWRTIFSNAIDKPACGWMK